MEQWNGSYTADWQQCAFLYSLDIVKALNILCTECILYSVANGTKCLA